MAVKRKTNKAKQFDASCRNNGSCPHCRSNRTHATRKRIAAAQEEVREYHPDASGIAQFGTTLGSYS